MPVRRWTVATPLNRTGPDCLHCGRQALLSPTSSTNTVGSRSPYSAVVVGRACPSSSSLFHRFFPLPHSWVVPAAFSLIITAHDQIAGISRLPVRFEVFFPFPLFFAASFASLFPSRRPPFIVANTASTASAALVSPPPPFRGGRFGGCRIPGFVPTASHATPAPNPAHAHPSSAALTVPPPPPPPPPPSSSPFLDAASPLPHPSSPSSARVDPPPPAVAVTPSARRAPDVAGPLPSSAHHVAPPSTFPSRPAPLDDYPQPPFRTGPLSPFRNRAAHTIQRPLRRLSAARLWNPTNSTPRGPAFSSTSFSSSSSPSSAPRRVPPLRQPTSPRLQPTRLHVAAAVNTSAARRRAPSTPPPPAVPLSHPVLHTTEPVADNDPIGTGAGDYPLLTLPEQRQIRHSTSTRASLQVERAGSEKRVSLPKSVRHSYDGKRLAAGLAALSGDTSTTTAEGIEAETGITPGGEDTYTDIDLSQDQPTAREQQQRPEQSLYDLQPSHQSQPQKKQQQQQPHPSSRPNTATTLSRSFGLVFSGIKQSSSSSGKQDKGKGKADATVRRMASPANDGDTGGDHAGVRAFSKDLERGPDVLNGARDQDDAGHRLSTVSMPDGLGLGSAISSSNSSIMGDAQPADMAGEEWGPQHPCYPHRNPHVPEDAPEYTTTRIIRIRRDWLIAGDLAPTFSNLYPEILDPAGLPEQEFRRVVDKLNRELTAAFAPWSVRNVVDGVLGLVTGWLWEDMGFTGAKARLARLERWIDRWNALMAAGGEGAGQHNNDNDDRPIPPKIIPLRSTGYMTLDIQIGDPEIAAVPPSTPAASRAGLASSDAGVAAS
ncbi:Golgin subfamily A member 7/ERF4 [Niveomyces insectorum RCEF 264]|uniref:Ras modification protein ERF4 n=1 Tax=Niveomyces insectorum RCEF 264 TaxID=1081102 RepID=A0A167NIH7_9HYPO|nr:Golgin subfamily A member 7/ERF4 [Niveomyces insectorum RCEF 264]